MAELFQKSVQKIIAANRFKKKPETNKVNKYAYYQAINEENQLRVDKTAELLGKLYLLDQYKNALADITNKIDYIPKNSIDQLYKLAENILNVFNISLNVITITTGDSGITIYPIDDKRQIGMHLAVILPELCKIPYTTLKKLGLRVLTFCSDCVCLKPNFKSVFLRKRYNGMFTLAHENTAKKVVKYFHKMICFQLVHENSSFTNDWKYVNKKDFVYGTKPENGQTVIGMLNEKCCESAFADQSEIFHAVLTEPNYVLKNHHDPVVRLKGQMMKDLFSKFESDGINFAFWHNLEISDHQGNNTVLKNKNSMI